MDLAKIKSVFLKIMIGCLVAAAGLAVVTVLVGEFNDVLSKSLMTILIIAIHSLVSFEFIDRSERQKTAENLNFFTNSTFIIIILSFITSLFGLWGLLDGELVYKLYATYFVLLFAVLHGDVLAKTLGKSSTIDNVVYSNYVLMGIVVIMIMPIIYMTNSSDLGEFYFRLLAAAGIIDATLTLVAIILYKLYLQKHPALPSAVFSAQQPGVAGVVGSAPQAAPAPASRRMNPFVVILVVYLVFQVGISLAIAVLGNLNR